jgi:ABC-2 type transport system permease protein
VLSTILLPVMLVLFSVAPALLSRGVTRTEHVAVVDATGDSLGMNIVAVLTRERLSGDSTGTGAAIPRYALTRVPATMGTLQHVVDSLVAQTGIGRHDTAGDLDGVLMITDTTLRSGKLEYLGDNTSALEAMGALEGSVSRVLVLTRLERDGINSGAVMGAMVPADMTTVKVSDGKATGESGTASFILCYVMGFLLYLMIIIYGLQTLTSVIEEKTSRIMEVLVSSVRPFQMLVGKIFGVGLTGLLQMAIWGGTIYLVGNQRAMLARMIHVSPAAMQQLPIPSMSTSLLVIFLLYFVLGFLLYGALYAAIGSMFNSVREAQQVASFVQITIFLGFMSLFAVMKDPGGGLCTVLSFVPFFSPFIMPTRWSLTAVPGYQLAISLALSVVALFAVAWIAGRIYRTGMLMYGKKPSLLQALKWVTTK